MTIKSVFEEVKSSKLTSSPLRNIRYARPRFDKKYIVVSGLTIFKKVFPTITPTIISPTFYMKKVKLYLEIKRFQNIVLLFQNNFELYCDANNISITIKKININKIMTIIKRLLRNKINSLFTFL